MKAVRIHQYGNADVLQIEDISVPDIKEDEVLIKIHATSVNPVDWKIREGYLRAMNLHTLPLTLGWDVSGTIEKAGSAVNNFQIGDEVYSRPAIERNGSYAEFIVEKANEVARKPKTMTHLEAASIPLAGITAWETLVTTAHIAKGQKVLIHAASGGVGTLAVQIAKAKGCYVIGTTSETNISMVKELGANEVVDYKKQDFSKMYSDIDVVLDTLGGTIQDQSWKVIKKGGILVSITQNPSIEVADNLGVRGAFVFISPNAAVLNELTTLIDAGKLKAVVSSVFSLDEMKQAHLLSESGRVKGKIGIKVIQ
jgi:NADPH:quinone reductase-like Zn-dependent oxidoreductase